MSRSRAELVADLRDLGLASHDAVLVHSSFKSLGEVDDGPAGFIEALRETVGPDGTLIFPTFNFDFCRGKPFEVRETPSRMGVLSETARNDKRAVLVRHPIYSFAVIGHHAQDAATIRNVSSYGADSLFGYLRSWDAKIMIIGLSYNHSMTYFHHVEEMEGCAYRTMTEFRGWVINNGSRKLKTATMFARNVDAGVVTDVDPMGAILESEGLVSVGTVGDATVKLMRARDVYDCTTRHLTDEPGRLYRIE